MAYTKPLSTESTDIEKNWGKHKQNAGAILAAYLHPQNFGSRTRTWQKLIGSDVKQSPYWPSTVDPHRISHLKSIDLPVQMKLVDYCRHILEDESSRHGGTGFRPLSRLDEAWAIAFTTERRRRNRLLRRLRQVERRLAQLESQPDRKRKTGRRALRKDAWNS
jgi:hypothetical protein